MPYLSADEGAWQGNNGPEENATAQDDLSVEAVAQVTEDGSCHHEAADEDCGRKKRERERKEKTLLLVVENDWSLLQYCVSSSHFAGKILEFLMH